MATNLVVQLIFNDHEKIANMISKNIPSLRNQLKVMREALEDAEGEPLQKEIRSVEHSFPPE